MKKKLLLALCLVLSIVMLVGCSSNQDTVAETKSLKTGLAVLTSLEKSKDAGEKDGVAQTDSTVVAVTVDEEGKIVDCIIDAAQTKINFSTEGKLVTDMSSEFKTKNELGADYGMIKGSKIGKEWNEQAASFAEYVIGKTVEDVKGIAVTEGKATDADLAASVTVGIEDFVAAIEKAVANAQDLGAKEGDKLGLAVSTNMEKSKEAAADKDGLAQAYSTYTVTTTDKDGKITSCVIDASQGNVNFDTTGKITSDLTLEVKTKNELGADYGMASKSSIGKEWNEQAAAFANYVVGKTVEDVKGIAVTEGKAADTDLAASVTIGIEEFMSNVEKSVNSVK